MSTLPIPFPCSWSGRILILRGNLEVVRGPWVNPHHGRGPRYQVTTLANRGTDIDSFKKGASKSGCFVPLNVDVDMPEVDQLRFMMK